MKINVDWFWWGCILLINNKAGQLATEETVGYKQSQANIKYKCEYGWMLARRFWQS